MKRTWLVLVGLLALALGIFVTQQVFHRSKTASSQGVVLTSKLAGENTGSGMQSLIPPGMRAVSVRVNEVIGNMAVLPGMRVDVLLTGSSSSANEEQTTTVLENVPVIATGQQQPQTARVITFLVSPEDAQKLTLANTQGRIIRLAPAPPPGTSPKFL
jgi:Flp pilus assembly protein CpaB